ncbi:nuclear factor of activated T-cells-like [Saccoglossus kowalevskii]|uniref:Nuclear factor of activated T-cells 5 n=1 Tax=Saccoglossus kowalevskii TaxID=10224 RepID=B5M234_SACKO|nr:nuclear factor of activated T-cells-like [Saccoglossus kowalevskii]ACH68446.1 NFAT-like protein [Saccoglossus kowalevskii]
MSPSSGYLSAMDELDGESLQELMSLTDENSIASLAELMESELPSKRKCRRLSLDQSSPSSPSESEDSPVFESDGAVASPTCFAFSKTILKNSEETSLGGSMLNGPLSLTRSPGSLSKLIGYQGVADGTKTGDIGESVIWDDIFSCICHSSQECAMETNPPVKPMKEPSLNVPFPSKENGIELKVLVQPESHHRARYQTEGSRGCVKDESQNAFPTVKLLGCNKPVALQVFIGNDSGKVKPHGFYQASRVCGRNNTPCEEKTIDATTVIEMFFDPAEDMVVSVDCVGIMKLRNADVEHKGLTLPRSKKRSTKARMVFRVNIPKDDGTYRTLQVASSQIACTQPTGMPEIMKKSLSSCSVKGGEELFVLGKNFVRGTTVKFQEICDDQIVWEESAKLDKENFQHNHLVCCIPPYKSQDISTSVEVSLVITTGNGRESDSQQFTYTPLSVADADAAQVRTEQYEAQMCTGNERKTSTEVESVKSRTEVPQHDQSLQSGNDSSFAEQLKMVALLATGQTNLNSGNGLAQKVMSVVNKHKQHQQSQHQQAILQQQQSYLVMLNQPNQRTLLW